MSKLITCSSLFLVSFVLLLWPTFSLGQKKSAGVYCNPTINFRTLPGHYKYLDKLDTKATTFAAGVFYSRNISKIFSLHTGIDYSITGYNRKPFTGAYFNYTASYKMRLHYVGIPVSLGIKLLNKRKFNINFVAGIVNTLLLFARYAPYDIQSPPLYFGNGLTDLTKPTSVKVDHSTLKSAGYNIYVPGLLGSFEFNYTFKDISVGIVPSFRYSMVSTTRRQTYFHTPGEHLYSYGVSLIVSRNW